MHIILAGGMFVLSYLIELLLCFKAKNKHTKLIPFYIGFVLAFICLLLYMGVFGNMSMGMLGNGHGFLALIILIGVLIMFTGLFLAQITHCIVKEKNKMKKYIKEIIILFLQLIVFYIIPLFAGPTDAMGMVFLIIISTLVLSFVLGIISGNNLKFLYPVAVSLLFIPSVFIYYNQTALIHSVWYLVVSAVGLAVGAIINIILSKVQRRAGK